MDALTDSYVELLGWEKTLSGSGWAGLYSHQGWILVFQEVEDYIPPVWPWKKGRQQQMAHMDFYIQDLDQAVSHALNRGAIKSEAQYLDTSTIMFDPEGHPFCLSTIK